MRILLITNRYQQFGSTDAIALAEQQMLTAHGQEVYSYTRDNTEIIDYSIWDKIASVFASVYSLRTQQEITRIVQGFKPDVAYIHNFLPLISPSVYHVLHSLGVPSLQVVHEFRLLCPNSHFYTNGGICERCKNGNYFHALRHRCYRDSYLETLACSATLGVNRIAGMLQKISGYLCLTEFSRQKLTEVGIPEQKLFLRPHSIDVSGIEPTFGEGSYGLFLGRLSEEKGLLTLIDAWSSFKNIKLKIAGTGPQEPKLREYVKMHTPDNIEFVGHTSGDEKWKLLRNSLFVIVPSEWYETFCMVVIEAYGAGKAVLGSNIGSLPYVIEDGKTGMLFEPGNVHDLRDKIQYLLSNPTRTDAMGRRGRTLAETKYHPDNNYKALMNIFTTLAGSPTGIAAVGVYPARS